MKVQVEIPLKPKTVFPLLKSKKTKVKRKRKREQSKSRLIHSMSFTTTASRPAQSPWSATMIGQSSINAAQSSNSPQAKYKKESAEVLDYIAGVHHSRKLPHFQVNYSSTVERLSEMQKKVPVYISRPEPVPKVS